MISLHRQTDLSAIRGMKSAYLRNLSAPMDGMWEEIIAGSPHWELRLDGDRAGYYAANDKGALLQFYLQPGFEDQSRPLFDHVVARGDVKKAIAMTSDSLTLGLCLDAHKSIKVHSYLYELPQSLHSTRRTPSVPDAPDLRPVRKQELEATVAFQQGCLADGKGLKEWLTTYSGNLIEKRELFVLSRDEEWIGLGEFRKSASQKEVVDLGVMVTPSRRGRGWASEILRQLVIRAELEGLEPTCSTTVENRAAQKVITRVGFVSRHRIVEVTF